MFGSGGVEDRGSGGYGDRGIKKLEVGSWKLEVLPTPPLGNTQEHF